MKILKKITLLILILSCCFSLHAGHKKYNNSCKPNYNGPDLRQQKQQKYQLKKQSKNMNIGKQKTKMSQLEQLETQFQKMSINEVDQDEKQSSLNISKLSYSQKTILALLTTVLILAAVTAKHNQKIIPHKIPHFDWNNKTSIYGPCEMLSNDTRFCCDIQSNYVVECCIGDNLTEKTEDLTCLSVDVEGIENQTEEDPFDAVAAYKEAKEMCTKRKHHFNVIIETTRLLEDLKPKYLQNLNGTECIIQKPSVNAPHITFPVTSPLNCKISAISISQTDILPSINFIVKKLSKMFNLSKNPSIFIYNKSDCPELSDYGVISIIEKDNDGIEKKINAVMLPYEILRKDFDEEIEDTLAHEIFHLKQLEVSKSLINSDKTGNNLEVEADMTSLLATQSPCSIFGIGFDEFPIPKITKKNVNKVLAGISVYYYRYPASSVRNFWLLLLHKPYKKIRNFLIMEELKRKEL